MLNVYGPHSSLDCFHLSYELIEKLPYFGRWIMVGDWNVIQSSRDKVGGSEKKMFDAE